MRVRDVKFGQLAIELGFLSREQLNACLDDQRQNPAIKLGAVASRRGLITEADVEFILQRQHLIKDRSSPGDPRFGEVAVLVGFMTQVQIDECLGIQQGAEPGKKIGRICVERGYLSPQQVDIVLRHRALPAFTAIEDMTSAETSAPEEHDAAYLARQSLDALRAGKRHAAEGDWAAYGRDQALLEELLVRLVERLP